MTARIPIRAVALACFLAAGCGPRPVDHDLAVTRDSAVAMFEAIPAALADRGPLAWLEFFEDTPTFVMASDGAVTFPSRDSATAFLQAFAPAVSAMALEWRDLRADAVSQGTVTIAAAYRERIVLHGDSTLQFGGYVTAMATSRAGTWRLRQLHWSSPRPSPTDAP